MRRKTSLVWIFSFADLAFILLLALAIMPKADSDYAKLKLSSVANSTALAVAEKPKTQWRIYVEEPSDKFSILVQRKDDNGEWNADEKVKDEVSLFSSLFDIKENDIRPEFIAAEKSNTGDMLLALSVIRKVWPNAEVWTTVRKTQESAD